MELSRLESERGRGSVTNKAVKEWTCGKRGMLLVLGGLPAARYSMCTSLSADTSFNDQNSTSGQKTFIDNNVFLSIHEEDAVHRCRLQYLLRTLCQCTG